MEHREPDEVLSQIRLALDQGKRDLVLSILAELHPADKAEVFLELTPDQQQEILPFLNNRDSAGIFEELEGNEAAEIAATLSSERLADVLDEMSPDSAADILGELPAEQATSALLQMEEPDEIANLLQYPDDTAGGLMTSDFLSFYPETTAQEVIDSIRASAADSDTPYYLYVTNHRRKLVGVIGLRALITSKPEVPIRTFMDDKVISVNVATDQEGVANLMKKYRLSLVPVVDGEGTLVGVIFSDDIVFVLEEEATEDILRLSNVSDSYLQVWSPISLSVRKRLPWLLMNLATAFLAASVVSIFENTIANLAILAAFQGMIAGQGGNAGTQTLALMVRGIAVGELDLSDTWRALGREFLIGSLNGLVIGLAVGIGAWIWQDMGLLGVLVAVSIFGNMVAAALAGTLVPLSLKALKLDPALASAVLVTTVTDCVGFGLFLGLATYFLPQLIG